MILTSAQSSPRRVARLSRVWLAPGESCCFTTLPLPIIIAIVVCFFLRLSDALYHNFSFLHLIRLSAKENRHPGSSFPAHLFTALLSHGNDTIE